MAQELFGKYVWLMDTIRRYGRITREELNRCWLRASITDGKPIPRRTFYNYRMAIQDLFNVNVECDPKTFEYYIEDEDEHNNSVTSWLLNSTAVNSVLSESRDVANRIFVEDVPSARDFLNIIISSLRENHTVKFTYHNYYRSQPQANIIVEPYFIKIFRQRWYLIGYNVSDKKIKTYALDRMSNVKEQETVFKIPEDFDPEEFCRYNFGVIFDSSEPKDVEIKVESHTAKYLRALPLHPSQQEQLHDGYSIFTYKLCLTADFVNEILSYGPRFTVLKPRELKTIVVGKLKEALTNYSK